MGNFIVPDWMPQPAAPLPPDPRVARAEKIANDTRVESELNRFIASKQDAMFDNANAFYRTQGEDAIHASPVTTKTLEQLRNDLLDGLDNDYQRQRLGAALDAQMRLTHRQMAQHVAEQSLVWQRGVAQDRIALLTREAALHHNDDDLIDAIGSGAAKAARAHARVGDGPIDTDLENAAAATAQSRIFSAAIQARLDKGLTPGAAALFDRTRDQLDPAHAESLRQQLNLNDEADGPIPPGQVVLLPVPGQIGEPTPQQPSDPPAKEDPNPPENAEPTDPPVDEEKPKDGAEEPEGIPDRAPTPIDSGREPGPTGVKLPASLIASPGFGVPKGPPIGSLPAAAARAAAAAAAVATGTVGTAALATAAAAGVMFIPRNFQGGIIDLGDDLRAKWWPDQRTAIIERRTSKGLFGTSVGEEWERLPVDATYQSGPDGYRTLRVDPQALKAAIAAPQFQALPASKPSILEIRIGASADSGATTTFREATHEEISRLCRAYPVVQDIGLRASMTVRATGLPNGLKYGQDVHNIAKQDILKIGAAEEILREIGMPQLLPEVALQAGVKFSYRRKGSSVLDVMEIPPKGGAVCVYDFKTGNATFPDNTMIRYAREAGAYVNALKMGYTRIYVVPIFVR